MKTTYPRTRILTSNYQLPTANTLALIVRFDKFAISIIIGRRKKPFSDRRSRTPKINHSVKRKVLHMADKKCAVGLVVLTDLPGIGTVAVLRRRGDVNPETGKSESYPGGCQVTAHGGAEKNEELVDVLKRELQEELGELGFALGNQEHVELSRLETDEKIVVTYGVHIPAEKFPIVFLPAGGVEGIQNLREFDKQQGVTDRRVIAMFPDEKEAIKKAFEMLGA